MKNSTYIILILVGLSAYLGYDNYTLRGGDPKALDTYFSQLKIMKQQVDELKEIAENCKI